MGDDCMDFRHREEDIYWSRFQTVQFFQILSESFDQQLVSPDSSSSSSLTRAISVDWSEWEARFMTEVADMISNKWLKFWIEIGAILSAIGLFEAQLSSSAYQLLGMTNLAFLPKFLAFQSKRFNTPWVRILLSTVVALGVSYMDYTDIASSANFLYSLGMLLEFASFLWLRTKFPTMKRPYMVVPLRLPALVLMCLIPAGFLVVIMALATKIVYLMNGLMTVAGILRYFLMRFCKSKGWLKQWRKVYSGVTF
ncbi:putative polyamine transporter [Forsythia ovata]|uniref:Polyamine transporter n=1 Tax=Forsythia ovata TaxID=205694 RepID=A0ABD1UUZ6_9LAMI